MILFWIASGAVLLAGILLSLALGPRRRGDSVLAAAVLTLLLVVTLGKILLLAGRFRPLDVTAAALVACGAAAGWLAASRAARRRAARTLAMFGVRPRLRFTPLAWVAVASMAAVTGYFGYLAVRLPPIAWDALYYHLIAVSQWVRTGSLVSPVPGMHSRATDVIVLAPADTFPKDSALVAAWFAVFTHSVRLIQLAQLVFLPLLFGGTYSICRQLGVRPRWALVAASLPVLGPAVLYQLATNYVDVACAAAVTAGWAFLLSAFPAVPDAIDRDEGPRAPRYRDLALAGACLGLAAGVKPPALLFCAASVPAVLALCAWRSRRASQAGDRTGIPFPVRSCAVLVMPMLAFGSFWYLRTWLRWGSPTWPVAVGPFAGRASAEGWATGDALAHIPSWQHEPTLVTLARSWAASVPALRPATLSGSATPGLTWLLLLLPAIAACLLIPGMRRRYRRGLFTAVLPLAIITSLSPGAWNARRTMLVLVAGAVAIAMLLSTERPARVRPLVWRAGTGLAGAVVLGLALGQAWSVAANPTWNVPPSVHGFRQVLALAASPARNRADIWNWRAYNAWQANMSGHAAVGFFAEHPPAFTLPYAGQHFTRPVVNIGDIPVAPGTHRPRWRAMRRMVAAAHVRYVYAPPGTRSYALLRAHWRPLPAVGDDSLFEAGVPASRSRLLATTAQHPRHRSRPRSRPRSRHP